MVELKVATGRDRRPEALRRVPHRGRPRHRRPVQERAEESHLQRESSCYRPLSETAFFVVSCPLPLRHHRPSRSRSSRSWLQACAGVAGVVSREHDAAIARDTNDRSHHTHYCSKARPMRLSRRQTVRHFRTKLSRVIASVNDRGNVTRASRSIAAPFADMFRTVHVMPQFSKVIVPPLKIR